MANPRSSLSPAPIAPELADGEPNGWMGAADRLIRTIGWPLILLSIALLPFARTYNVPVIVMASFGLGMIVIDPQLRRDPRIHLLALLFLCLWLPMLASLPGAVQPQRALRTTLGFLRFPLAGVFIVRVLRDPIPAFRLSAAIAAMLLIWCADALLQWRSGRNTFGAPYDGTFVTGLFHPNRSIGLFIAILLPVHLEFLRRLAARYTPAVWLLAAPCILVILLGGTRTGWLLLGIALPLWGGWLWYSSMSRHRHVIAVAVMLLAVAVSPMIARIPGVSDRIELSAQVLKGDYESIDRALTRRLPIWAIGWNIARDHWLTGVGPRGYRFIYASYADESTPWVRKDGLGAAHPHLTILEIAAETGAIGLVGYALFAFVFIRASLRSMTPAALPWLLAATLAFLPINTYKAFYSTEWSHLAWLVLLVGIALLAPRAVTNTDSSLPETTA